MSPEFLNQFKVRVTIFFCILLVGQTPALANIQSNQLTCKENFEVLRLSHQVRGTFKALTMETMGRLIQPIGEAPNYSPRVKRSVFKAFNRELGVDLWLSKEFFLGQRDFNQGDLMGWAFVGSIANEGFHTGLFISLEGHVVKFIVTPEILEISNLNLRLIDGNYVTQLENRSLHDEYSKLLEEMILLGTIILPEGSQGSYFDYADFLEAQ